MTTGIDTLLFVGSGFSINQGGPSWESLRHIAVHELVGHLSEGRREQIWSEIEATVLALAPLPHGSDLERHRGKPEFCMYVLSQFFGGHVGLKAFLQRHLLTTPTYGYFRFVVEAVRRKWLILTTEFDGLFALALRVMFEDALTTGLFLAPETDARPVVTYALHGRPILAELHGSVERPRDLVCQPRQVMEWLNAPFVTELASWLADARYAVFWGCGGRDPDIWELFRNIGTRGVKFEAVYALQPELDRDPLLGDLQLHIPCSGAVLPLPHNLSPEGVWRAVNSAEVST